MKNKAVLGTLHVAAVLALCAAGSPRAQSLPPDSAFSSGWTYEATPYLWFAGVKGDTRVGTRLPAVAVDASFSDLASNLDLGLMGSFEARRQRWGGRPALQQLRAPAAKLTTAWWRRQPWPRRRCLSMRVEAVAEVVPADSYSTCSTLYRMTMIQTI